MSGSSWSGKRRIPNAPPAAEWAPARNGTICSRTFGRWVASTSASSCACITAGAPIGRRNTASSTTAHSWTGSGLWRMRWRRLRPEVGLKPAGQHVAVAVPPAGGIGLPGQREQALALLDVVHPVEREQVGHVTLLEAHPAEL